MVKNLHADPLLTNLNFREFFKRSSSLVSQQDSDFLNHVFRQGLTHLYFPKLGLAISYHSTNPPGQLFFKAASQAIVLNVKRLEEIVISTFETIKSDVSIYQQMETRYQSLISKYQQQNGGTIAKYKNTL